MPPRDPETAFKEAGEYEFGDFQNDIVEYRYLFSRARPMSACVAGTMPASRNPGAIWKPASPKPIKPILGFGVIWMCGGKGDLRHRHQFTTVNEDAQF
jgi:hypothetical protein